MNRGEKRNVGHSLFQRLLVRAKKNQEDFNHLLSRYGMERFLYRLGISTHSDRFILKGASLFLVWKGRNYRVTKDVDLLGLGDSDLEALAGIFRNICRLGGPEDGMTYPPEFLKAEEIRENHDYNGVRMTLTGILNQVRIPLQIDIGFGDVVTPAPEIIDYPTILDSPAPRMKAYPRYTLIAEKLEALVRLGLANSRMKDFFDIWLLSRLFEFEGGILGDAISNTFDRRRTNLPGKMPFAFTSDFYEDPIKRHQWKAFVRRTKPDVPVGELASIIVELSRFLVPILNGLEMKRPFDKTWHPEKGWDEIP